MLWLGVRRLVFCSGHCMISSAWLYNAVYLEHCWRECANAYLLSVVSLDDLLYEALSSWRKIDNLGKPSLPNGRVGHIHSVN